MANRPVLVLHPNVNYLPPHKLPLMPNFGMKNPKADLAALGLPTVTAHWNQSAAELIERTVQLNEGVLTEPVPWPLTPANLPAALPKTALL